MSTDPKKNEEIKDEIKDEELEEVSGGTIQRKETDGELNDDGRRRGKAELT